MVHFADASPNEVAIRTGGAKGLGWPSPNVFRATAAVVGLRDIDITRF